MGAPVTGLVLSPRSPPRCSLDALPQLTGTFGGLAPRETRLPWVPGWDANNKKNKYCTVGGFLMIIPCPRAISSWLGKDNATNVLRTNTHTHACTHTHTHSGTHTAGPHTRPLPDPLRPIHTRDWTLKYTHRPHTDTHTHTQSGQGWSQRI